MCEEFVLDARLQADTFFLADLSLCRVLLMNDRRYPWVILVPRRAGLTELHQLNETDTQQLWRESRLVSQILISYFRGDSLNVAALGNVVAQLHVHHVLRSEGDPAWPGPVWGHSAAQSYVGDDRESTVKALSDLLLKG